MSNTDMNLNCQSVQARLAASWGYVKPSAVRAGYFAYDAEHNIWEEVSSADAPGAMALYMVGDIPETTGAAAIKLPIDVTIGCVTIKAGCSLQTLLTRIEIINQTWQPKALADPFAASGKLITEQDHIAAPGKPIAEPVKQEPVAHYKDAPHTIYLQTGCDDPDPVNCECAFNEWGDTSWCADQIHDTDIPYIRADYAAQVDAKAIRAEALDEAAMLAYDLRFRSCWTAEAIAAAIRKLK